MAAKYPSDAESIVVRGHHLGGKERRVDSGRRDATRSPSAVGQVQQRERHVGVFGAQELDEIQTLVGERLPVTRRIQGRERKRVEYTQPALVEHACRRLAHDGENSDHLARSLAQRAVRVREVALLEKTVTIAREQEIFRPAR